MSGGYSSLKHIDAFFADGYFSSIVPDSTVIMAYRKYVSDFLRRLEHVFPANTPQPLTPLARLALARCCRRHIVSEAVPLPKGSVVLAFSHNIPFIDAAGILAHLSDNYPDRKVALVASMRTLSKVIPGWAWHNDGQFSVIEVTWQLGENGETLAANGDDVVCSAIQFLQGGDDRILLIAPDGRLSLLRNGVLLRPFRGVDLIAQDAEAQIVPVVTTARPNTNVETCDFALVHTCFSQPMDLENDRRPSQLWASVVSSMAQVTEAKSHP